MRPTAPAGGDLVTYSRNDAGAARKQGHVRLLGAVISAWPAVAFIGSVEMVMGLVRRARRERGPVLAPAGPPVPGGEGVAAAVCTGRSQ
jgi:hypothetical protein